MYVLLKNEIDARNLCGHMVGSFILKKENDFYVKVTDEKYLLDEHVVVNKPKEEEGEYEKIIL